MKGMIIYVCTYGGVVLRIKRQGRLWRGLGSACEIRALVCTATIAHYARSLQNRGGFKMGIEGGDGGNDSAILTVCWPLRARSRISFNRPQNRGIFVNRTSSPCAQHELTEDRFKMLLN